MWLASRKMRALFIVSDKAIEDRENYKVVKNSLDAEKSITCKTLTPEEVEQEVKKQGKDYYNVVVVWLCNLNTYPSGSEAEPEAGIASYLKTVRASFPSLAVYTVIDAADDEAPPGAITQYSQQVLQNGAVPFAPPFNADVLVGHLMAAMLRVRRQRILSRYVEQATAADTVEEVSRLILNSLKDLTNWGKATIMLISDLSQLENMTVVALNRKTRSGHEAAQQDTGPDAASSADNGVIPLDKPYLIRSLLLYDGYGKEYLNFDLIRPLDEDDFIREIIEQREPKIYPGVNETPPPGWHGHQREQTQDIQSWLGLPLYEGKNPIALVVLENRYDDFEGVDLQILKLFAQQAASTLRRAQLTAGQKRLQEASQAVASNLDLTKTFFTITQYVNELTSSTYSYIVRPQYKQGKIHMDFVAAWPRQFLPGLQTEVHFAGDRNGQQVDRAVESIPHRPKGFTNYVYENKKALLVNDVTQIRDKKYREIYYPYRDDTRTEFTYPIMNREKQVLAVLNLEHHYPFAFTAEQLNLVEGLANSIAITIEKNLYIEERNQRQQQLLMLQAASEAMATTLLEPEQIIQIVVDHTKRAFGATALILAPLDAKGNFDQNRLVTEPMGLKEDIDIREDGISQKVKKYGMPQYFDNIEDDRAELNEKMLRDGQTRSAICLPLRAKNTFVGVIWIHFDEPQEFTSEEKEVYDAYAKQVALAYDNALYSVQLQKRLAKATTEFTEQLTGQYGEARKQANQYHIFSIVVSAIGFITVLISVVVAAFVEDTPGSLIGSFGALFAVLFQAASIFVFSRAQEKADRLNDYHKELFEVGAWYILQQSVDELEDGKKFAVKETLIDTAAKYWLQNRRELEQNRNHHPPDSQNQTEQESDPV